MNLGVGDPLSHEFTAEIVHKSNEARQLIEKIIRAADFGLNGVTTEPYSISVNELQPALQAIHRSLSELAAQSGQMDPFATEGFRVAFQHQGRGGDDFSIPWEVESAGTQRFFSIIGPWLEFIRNDHVVCVDELETSLHPLLASELLKLFVAKSRDNGRSQLLFTTHNPLLLDSTLLRRDQVWFADKNTEGESFLYPLTDYKPRVDESLLRGYMSGRYGAIPFIPSGLIEKVKSETEIVEATNAS